MALETHWNFWNENFISVWSVKETTGVVNRNFMMLATHTIKFDFLSFNMLHYDYACTHAI